MTYLELIQKLFKINLFRNIKLGLENAQHLQELLNFPDRMFTTIHVAGTNGKGSVSTKIAYAFEQEGYRVGLYTSPHISTFRERIRINRIMIPEEKVESLLAFLFQLIEFKQIPATFFELTTFLAFLYFAQEKVEVAVIETGLGGRLDATNVIYPCLSIITSISLDHTDILGHTRESITLEKGGIIKEKIPVIIGPQVPFKPIEAIALQKQSLCIQVKEKSPLFEEENRHIARTALNYLTSSFRLSSLAIKQGLEGRQPCRFEIFPGACPIILDVAHNPDGLQHLFQMMAFYYPNYQVRLLFGLSKNKDLKECLKIITTHGTYFHLVEANNGRGVSLNDLYIYVCELGIAPYRVSIHNSIFEGICQAKEEASKHQEILLICGSFFIMNQARQALGIHEPHDALNLNEYHTCKIEKNNY